MDSEITEIPKNNKYTLCFLDSTGKPSSYILFGGTSPPMSDDDFKQYLFSNEDDRMQFDILDPLPTFHQSSQQIHPDDSIRTIKKKIIHEIGANNICYEEIYLFANFYEEISLLDIYQKITNKKTIMGKGVTKIERQLLELETYQELDKRTLGQLLLNLKTDKVLDIGDKDFSKDIYTFEDLQELLSKKDDYMVSKSIGQRFSKSYDYLFSGNPFDVLSGEGSLVFQRNKLNDIYVFENQLLLNYGKIDNNIIYVCRTEQVLEYANKNNIRDDFFIDLYYPLLYKKGIKDSTAFSENLQQLISKNSEIIKPNTMKLFDIIDSFYNIYYGRSSELPYIERGVESFDIIMHPKFDVPLPLDIIFKQIHATKNIPFIKYNPGLRRENQFRLYSEEIAKNGKKIPYLKKSQIYAISKQTGKLRQVSLFSKYETKKQTVELLIDFEYNGNIRLRSNLTKSISINDVETVIYNTLNPILISINEYLERSGYTIALFENLGMPNIEIIYIDYNCKINLKQPLKLQKYIGCLTTLFDIPSMDFDITKTVNMQFIRVDNYVKMNAIAAMITDVFRRTNNQEEIINALMMNFSLSRDDASKEIVKYFNDHIQIQGQYVNKSMDIADNPGFPVSFQKSPFDDKLIIRVKKINSVQFIDIIHVYLDSILRLSQQPESIEDTIRNGFSSLCSNKPIAIEKEVVENVITKDAILIAPVVFEAEEDELEEQEKVTEEEEEEEDEEDKYLPGDEEEEEDEQEESEEEEEESSEESLEKSIENVVESVVEESAEKHVEKPAEKKKETTPSSKSSSEESDRYLPSDDDDDDYKGGARPKSAAASNPSPEAKREKSNIFTKRIKDREPNLILTKKQGKFSSYSRICPANVSLQPVILTDEEKRKVDEEHPGSYTNAIQYGTDPKNPYWYICPRYWCLKNNAPMTEEEVKRGECGGKIIPDNAKAPPPGHFIYEFTDDKYHKDEKGNYVYHSPGFKPEHSHPDKLCLPCCYNKWSTYNIKNPGEQQKRRQQCGLTDRYVFSDEKDSKGEPIKKLGPDGKPMQIATYKSQEEIEEEELKQDEKEDKKAKKPKKDIRELEAEKQRKKTNVFGVERIPIPQYRWGFLPLSIELFLHTDNTKFVVKTNPALIQSHKRPLLRYGVEYSVNQSFMAVLADIYSYYHNVPLPSIAEMRDIIIGSLTLDNFLRLHNGSLLSIFKPSRIRVSDDTVEKYKNTEFYKKIRLNIPAEYHFLQDTISSFENFVSYLKDADSIIDHTYLWDIISSESSPIFNKGGLNMVIVRIYDNDFTDNVELICPTSAYSENVFIKERGTVLLLLHNDFYEPIYLYGDADKETPIPPVKIFTENNGNRELKQMQKIFEKLFEFSGKYCKPVSIKPRNYQYKDNISVNALREIVEGLGFSVLYQVMNYQGKTIGLSVSIREGDNAPIFLPCFPSAGLENVPKKYSDDVKWLDYETTRDRLNQISTRSQQRILCKPLVKVVEDGLIVGLLTETNQFIFIEPPIENTVEDGLPVLQANYFKNPGYYRVNDTIATTENFDQTRINTVHNITLETQFYYSFRSILRNLLNDYLYRNSRQEIIRILEDTQILYTIKVKKIETILRDLSKDYIDFIDEIEPEAQKELGDELVCTTNCDIKSYCLIGKNKLCIPKKHLVSGKDNQVLYYARAADELVRYKRIQLFMLEPRRYLNITNIDYSINEDEVLLLASVLNDAYFEDLVPYNKNRYVKNISYGNAEPVNYTPSQLSDLRI